MKPLRALVGALLLALAAPAAAAESSSGGPTTVLLPMTLKGSSTGKGTFEFGVGAAWRLGKNRDYYDLGVAISGDVATSSGLANLFGVSSSSVGVDQSLPWTLGATISLANLEAPDNNGPNAGLPSKVRRRMFNACNATCELDPSSAFCKGRGDMLVSWASEFVEQNNSLAADSFCKAKQREVQDLDTKANIVRAKPEIAGNPSALAAIDKKQAKDREGALNACVAACAIDATDPFCTAGDLKQLRASFFQGYDGTTTCELGKKIYDKFEDRKGRSLFPRSRLVAGFKIGRQSFAYREPSSADPSLLASKKDHEAIWKAGLIGSILGKLGPVRSALELQALLDSSMTAATTTVKWCKSEGGVARPGAAPDPAQSCDEATLGAPTRTSAFTARIHGSLFDSNRGSWRVAFGPEISIPFSSTGAKNITYGLALPVYLSSTLFEKVEYNGLLQLTPTLGYRKLDDATNDISITVELAVLGQRGIFSNQFDSL